MSTTQTGNGKMTISPGYNRDPLKPRGYNVIAETPDGHLMRLNPKTLDEPIELLRLDVEKNHVVGLHTQEMAITDAETGEVVEVFRSYKPEPQSPDEPITSHNEEIRDRWIGKMLAWLLTPELLALEDNPENQAKIRAFLDEQKVSISVSPGGTQVVFLREGQPLAGWKAFV